MSDQATITSPKSDAERARDYRARKKSGARCLRIEISNAEETVDAFVNIGVLAEERRNDDQAIEAAISVLCKRGYSAIKAERETDRDAVAT
jgi:predicted GNAT superfamily acetyltransferase